MKLKGALDLWTFAHIAAGFVIAGLITWAGGPWPVAIAAVLVIGLAWELYELIAQVDKYAAQHFTDLVANVAGALLAIYLL